ncbi:AraC family transcriptional regulator [Myxococcota bacterium]|nr:AraC family transcriptional regulator [Myxococcota bacterium]
MSELSVLAALPLAVLEAAASLGLDASALREEAGLDAAALDDPDGRVPVERDLALWTALSRGPHGLAIGERLGIAGLGVLGYAMQHGGSVREALDWLVRYRSVVHPGLVPEVELRAEPAGARVVFTRPVPPPWAKLREPVYAQAASLVTVTAAMTGQPIRAAFVAYPMPRPADPERHERFFECPVAWGASKLEVAFDATILDLPLPRRDPRLFGYLARRADELLTRLPDESTATSRARREIAELLTHGEPRLGALAKRLATSERTLSRRLQDEGTTFAALVDEARRERALLLLEDPHLSASEIAFLLGYAEPAVFFRAFKRWTQETPQSWRARSRATRPRP